MKRLFLLSCLLLPGFRSALAEGLRWSGSFVTGVTADIPQKGESDVRLETDDGFGPVAARLRLLGGLEQKTWGLRFRLQGGLDTDYTYGFQPGDQYAYIWTAFFKDRLRLYAGKMDGDLWNTPFDNSWGLDAVTGLRFEVKPADGLSFGGALKTPPLGEDAGGKYTLERVLSEAVIGARWDTPWFMAAGAFGLDGWDNYRADEQALVAGLSLKSVPDLLLGIEGKMENILSGGMTYRLMEKAGYPLNPLTYGTLRVYQSGGEGREGFDLKINPEVSLWLTGRFQPALELEAGGNTAAFGDTFYAGVKPKGLWKLSPGMNIDFYYLLRVSGAFDQVDHTLNLSFTGYF